MAGHSQPPSWEACYGGVCWYVGSAGFPELVLAKRLQEGTAAYKVSQSFHLKKVSEGVVCEETHGVYTISGCNEQ